MIGGNQHHDGSTQSTLVLEGASQVSGNEALLDVDHIVLDTAGHLAISSAGSAIAQITGGAMSTVEVQAAGTWVITADSRVGNVQLDLGGSIDFGDPSTQHGTPGRLLEVENWQGNGGDLKMYGRVGSDNVLYKDQLQINGQGRGNTEVNFIDRGGVTNRIAGGEPVVVVRPGSTGAIDEGSFRGKYIDGTLEYDLERTAEGGYAFNASGLQGGGSTTPLYAHYSAALQNLSRPQLLGSLEELTRLTERGQCDAVQAFGRITGGSGDSSRSTGNSGHTSYRDTQILTGSGATTHDMGEGCLQVGVFGGYADRAQDYYLGGSKQGKHDITSQQLGSYVRYDSQGGWYMLGSAVHSWHDLQIKDQADVDRQTDSTSVSLGIEGGVRMELSEQMQLRVSGQWIYERSQVDGVRTAIAHTEFDTMQSNYVRLGGALSYAFSESTNVQIEGNVWHGLNNATRIRTYYLDNGQFINALENKTSPTWIDVGVGIKSQIDSSLSVFATLGAQGSGASHNLGFTARAGLLYRW